MKAFSFYLAEIKHYLNSVEFIKAGPCPSLCQPLKEFAHCLVIEAIGTIEDNTLQQKHTEHFSVFPQSAL